MMNHAKSVFQYKFCEPYHYAGYKNRHISSEYIGMCLSIIYSDIQNVMLNIYAFLLRGPPFLGLSGVAAMIFLQSSKEIAIGSVPLGSLKFCLSKEM